MYTQCPECDAVYRVTSAHLRLAGGEVQCGTCGARFDALDRLSDTYPKPPPAGPDQAEAELPPEPEQPPAATDHPEPGSEPATVDQGEPPDAPDTEKEPLVEPDESTAEALVEADESTAEAPDEARPPDQAPVESDGADESTGSAVADAGAPRPEDAGPSWSLSPDDTDDPTVNLDVTAEELFSIEELGDQDMPDVDELEFVEGLPSGQEETPEDVREAPPGELLAKRSSGLLRWTRRIVLLIALLALVAAAVHSQRAALMRNPTLAPWLERVYGGLGLALEPAWDVSAYQIVDSAAGIDGDGDLQVTLTLSNGASFRQPYPVLRVSLEDRWGDEIGSRELQPRDYLAGYVAGRLMSPGSRTEGRATVDAPPAAAVGFRLDLCLPDADRRLVCASDQP